MGDDKKMNKFLKIFNKKNRTYFYMMIVVLILFLSYGLVFTNNMFITGDASSVTAALDKGNILSFSFDSDASDESVNNEQTTINGATWNALNGTGYYSFGSNNHIVVDNSGDLDGFSGITVEGVARKTDGGAWQYIVAKGAAVEDHSWGIYYDQGNNEWLFAINDRASSSVVSSSKIASNEWGHVVGTYDGSNIKIYFNGDLIESRAYSTPLVTNPTVPVIIGARSNGGTSTKYTIDGDVGLVNVYDYALDSNTIKERYDSFESIYGIVPYEVPVLPTAYHSGYQTPPANAAQFSYDFTSSASGNDKTGNGYTATVNGATWSAQTGISNTSSLRNGSYYFDGVNDYITISASENIDSYKDRATISFWVKKDTPATSKEYVFSKLDETGRDLFTFFTDTDDEWQSGVGGPTIGPRTAIDYGKWTHVVLTLNRYYDEENDGSNIYINGEFANRYKSFFALDKTVLNDITIGAARNSPFTGSRNFFNGHIAEVTVYDGTFTPEQVMELYVSGSVNFTQVENDYPYFYSSEAGANKTHTTIVDSDCDFIIDSNSSWLDDSDVSDAEMGGVSPGDVICLRAGNWGGFTFEDIIGEEGNEVIVTNLDGVVYFDQSASAFSFMDSKHIKILGNGHVDHKYGIKHAGGQIWSFIMAPRTKEVEIAWVELTRPGFAAMNLKTEPSCTNANNNHPNFEITGWIIHDNYIHDTDCEGLYIGHTFVYGDDGGKYGGCTGTTLYPAKTIGTQVYNNIFERTGCEAIQSSDLNVSVYNNLITDAGYNPQSFAVGQDNAIQIGGGGRYFNNTIRHVLESPFIIFSRAPTYIYNNVIEDGGMIYIHKFTNTSELRIFNNVFDKVAWRDNQERGAISLASNEPSLNVYVENNIFIEYFDTNFFNNEKNHANVFLNNNYVTTNASDLLFVNHSNYDYRLTKNSPAVNNGSDSSYYGILTDLAGRNRFVGESIDIGPYEYDPACEVDGVCNPTCSDGYKNQDETDIDCGGNVCSACIIPDVIDSEDTAKKSSGGGGGGGSGSKRTEDLSLIEIIIDTIKEGFTFVRKSDNLILDDLVINDLLINDSADEDKNIIDISKKSIGKKIMNNSEYKLFIKKDEHKIRVLNVNTQSIVVEIRSEPIIATFFIGETKSFDLDNNSIDDLSVTLVDIVDLEAVLIFENLERKTIDWKKLILAIFMLSLFVGIIWFIIRKRN